MLRAAYDDLHMYKLIYIICQEQHMPHCPTKCLMESLTYEWICKQFNAKYLSKWMEMSEEKQNLEWVPANLRIFLLAREPNNISDVHRKGGQSLTSWKRVDVQGAL